MKNFLISKRKNVRLFSKTISLAVDNDFLFYHWMKNEKEKKVIIVVNKERLEPRWNGKA